MAELKSLSQYGLEFEASLGYITRLCHKACMCMCSEATHRIASLSQANGNGRITDHEQGGQGILVSPTWPCRCMCSGDTPSVCGV